MVIAIPTRDWEFSLFLHVLGATILVGLLFAVATALVFAWKRAEGGEELTLTRFAYKTLLFGVIPAWILMRIPAQITFEESIWGNQKFGKEDPWLLIGYTAADGGIAAIIAATALARFSVQKLERDGADSRLGRLAALATIGVLVLSLIAVYAMTAKPT